MAAAQSGQKEDRAIHFYPGRVTPFLALPWRAGGALQGQKNTGAVLPARASDQLHKGAPFPAFVKPSSKHSGSLCIDRTRGDPKAVFQSLH